MNSSADRLSRHVHDVTPESSPPFEVVLTRLDQRRRRRRAFASVGVAVVAVTAIVIGGHVLGWGAPTESAGPGPGPAAATSRPVPTEIQRQEPTYEWSGQPSPVVLLLGGRNVELKPWSYCWDGPPDATGTASGLCADGFAQTRDLEGVGSPGSVDFWFGVDNWDFKATFTELGVECPRQHTVPVMRTGDQTFRLYPAGPAGRYRVDLFGRGRHGDVSMSFLWTTPTGGPVDQPAAYIALVSGDGDQLWAYQLEVGVQDLAFQPKKAEVEVTATAANGRSMTLDAELEHRGNCYAEGSLFFRGKEGPAQLATHLGPAPFTYEVLLTLGGKRYVGAAVWPRDEKKDEAPNTVLTFDPPLPAYTGE